MRLVTTLRCLAPALLALLAACSARDEEQVRQEETTLDPAAIKADLEVVAGARILLGHQSVGRDVLAGVSSLARDNGVPLRIQPIDGLPPDGEPGLFHTHIGKNGDPDSKCELFEQLLVNPQRPAYDVAMMKLCYVDLGRGLPYEAAGLLDRYSKVVAELKSKRPDVQLVHISMPLRADPPGRKAKVQRMLTLATSEDADNELRNAYNEGLRKRFANEPIFDLASVESTRPDGTRSSFEKNGQAIFTLAAEYTTDGGHLNPEGQRRVAAEFLRTTASALRQRSSSAAHQARDAFADRQ
jgi:hypothetical protein